MSRKIINSENASFGKAFALMAKNFCIGFTIVMLAAMAAAMVLAPEGSRDGIAYCWEIVAAIFCAVLLQAVFFTPLIIKNMTYAPRIAIFGICLYTLIALCSIAFNWFPSDSLAAWVGFTVVYVAILAIMTAVFSMVYKRENKTLNDGLEKFKSTNKMP